MRRHHSFGRNGCTNTPLSYTLPLGHKLGDISYKVNYVWTGSQYVSADIHAFNQLPACDKVDLRVTWENINGFPFDIAGYMTNATNNTYRAGRYPLVAQLGFDSSTWAERSKFCPEGARVPSSRRALSFSFWHIEQYGRTNTAGMT